MGQILFLALRLAVIAPEPATGPAPVEFAIRRPIVLAGMRTGTPTGVAPNVGVLIPLKNPSPESRNISPDAATRSSRAAASAPRRVAEDPVFHEGVLIEAAANANASRLAVGWGGFYKVPGKPGLYGVDFTFSSVRTKGHPRNATPNSHYLGAEANMHILGMRVGIGVGHRVSGGTGEKGTIFTWTLGVQIGY